jgi:hypothetical protein
MLSELKLLLADDNKLINVLKYLNPRKPKNVTLFRVGNECDGGYVMLSELIKKNSISYSFGVGGATSWEDQISKEFNNKIYMYDHTINGINSSDPNFIWKKIGIGKTDSGNINTIETIIKNNKHENETDMTLQCDIEGSEWDIFIDTPQETLCQFAQMNVEMHWLSSMLTDDIKYPDGYEKIFETLKKLRENFTPFHIHGNNYRPAFNVGGKVCGDVIEVSYVRNDLVEFSDEDVVFPTSLDRPNKRNRPDIKLGNFKW